MAEIIIDYKELTTKTVNNTIYDKMIKNKNDIENSKKYMFYFSERNRTIGNFTKDFHVYYNHDHDTFKYLTNDEKKQIFDKFPEQFKKTTFLIIFNFTHWIGIDIDDITYKIKYDFGDDCFIESTANYNNCNSEQKAIFNKHITELGERSNPKLMIFHKDHPEIVHLVKINIWKNPTAFDYCFRIEYRSNRIYLSDYDGFKVFDFELNLIYFKKLFDDSDFFCFVVDPENWNKVRIWSTNQANNIRNLSSYSFTSDSTSTFDSTSTYDSTSTSGYTLTTSETCSNIQSDSDYDSEPEIESDHYDINILDSY